MFLLTMSSLSRVTWGWSDWASEKGEKLRIQSGVGEPFERSELWLLRSDLIA